MVKNQLAKWKLLEQQSYFKTDDLPFDVDEDKLKVTKKTDDVVMVFDDLFNN